MKILRIAVFLSFVVLLEILSFQVVAQQRVADKQVFKNGKFYFYNHSLKRDTISLAGEVQPVSLPCLCGVKSPQSRLSILNGNQIVLYIISTDATCGYGSGSIIVQATNGTAPYTFTDTYNGFTDPPQNTGNFPVIGAGTNTITVTDANGLTATTDVVINNILPGPIIVPYFVTKTPSDCFAADGEVTLQPNGGTPPYAYSIDLVNFQTSNVFSNLHAGIYQFYVKDAVGCIGNANVFVVNGLCDALVFFGGGYTCAKSGQLSVQDRGSQTPYQYSLDGVTYQSTGDFNNIGPGIATIYIKNSAGNVKIFAVNYAENCSLNLQYIAVDAACQQNNGSMTITGANGTPPYSYTIDGINYQNSNVFTNLAPGNYSVTVKDAVGEKSSLSATVYDKCPIVRAVPTGETCIRNDGTIIAGGFKGTAPYLFSIDGVNFQSNNLFNGLKAGKYVITLKDAMGFTDTVHVAVPDSCLVISSTTKNSTCSNSNGSITVNVSGGSQPYQYSIDGTSFQSSNIIGNLKAGNHIITVKDASGTTGTANVTISDTPGAMILATSTAAGCMNNDGTIIISGTGGTTPFQFSLDNTNYQNNSMFNGIDTGTKRAYIKDGNGCVTSQIVIVSLNDDLKIDAGNNITICEGVQTNLNATSNGTSFLWSPTTGLSNTTILNPQASPDITTKYFVTAKEGICSHKDSVTVFVNPAPIADAGINESICFGKSVQLNGSGGAEYSWTPPTYLSDPQIQNPIVTQPSSTITYSLRVTDANGCNSLQASIVTVTVTPSPKVFAGNDTAILVNQSLQLNAIDVSNSGFTNYLWSPATGLNNVSVQNPVAIITHDITYTITASTPAGCEGSDSINIKVYLNSDIYVPNAFTPNNDGRNDVLRARPFGIKIFRYFEVYNRFGERVFYTTDASIGWDGTFHSMPQDTGIYVWMCAGVDFNGRIVQHRGSVILIR